MASSKENMDIDSPVKAIDDTIQEIEQTAKKLKRDIDGDVQNICYSTGNQQCCKPDVGENLCDVERIHKRPRIEGNGTLNGKDQEEGKGKNDIDTRNGGYKKGVAPVKKEFLVLGNSKTLMKSTIDDDASEAGGLMIVVKGGKAEEEEEEGQGQEEERGKRGKKKKRGGQNKGRKFQFQHDTIQLCPHLNLSSSTTNPLPCLRLKSGKEEEKENSRKRENGYVDSSCTFEHDIKKYVAAGKKEDLEGTCPVWDERGECISGGWRCRWLSSHVRKLENGEMELIVDEERKKRYLEKIKSLNKGDEPKAVAVSDEERGGGGGGGKTEILNEVDMSFKVQLRKQQYPFKKSQTFLDAQEKIDQEAEENRAMFVEERIPRWEKRPIDISPDRPILAPLTTVGNLPFRRLCTQLGAAMTYSEMAMSYPLIQGQKSEWALLRSHVSEIPNFGAQICAMKPWQAVKATETITNLIPSRSMNLIDLNCGCPIDMVYQNGGGSALLDQQGKLIKMLRGMNRVSGDTPITCKIRMGTKDNHPTAKRVLQKLYNSGEVAAITLHGRSRQQRYTKEADWKYISECAVLINSLKEGVVSTDDNNNNNNTSSFITPPKTETTEEQPDNTETFTYREGHDLPQISSSSVSGHGLGGRTGHGLYFIGNGDIFSHSDYYTHVSSSPLDSVMIARGALIKPWIFEEISSRQYLDKSPSERLGYIKDFARYGLETWGSDEFGIQTTRRFLCEWLSFACRYVPVGILERLPPKIQDRPPLWRGRDEMETLLGSTDVKDWIKISEMYLGKVGEGSGWSFLPKHKSNAYEETEGEG